MLFTSGQVREEAGARHGDRAVRRHQQGAADPRQGADDHYKVSYYD